MSGNIVEIYRYEHEFAIGYKVESTNAGRKKGKADNYNENRKKTLIRASKELRRIINSNVYQYDEVPKFLTLTFVDNIQDLDYAHSEFKKFLKRLNYHVFGTKKNEVKYSAVVEFQKRGAIHYHVLLYNAPYIDAGRLSEIWANGFIRINKIDKIDNLGAYVTKYMTKDNSDERLQGRKCYFNSKNLKKPVELTDKEKIAELESLAIKGSNRAYHSVYDNDYLGTIMYSQYNITDG